MRFDADEGNAGEGDDDEGDAGDFNVDGKHD